MIRVLAALTACLALFASPAHAADDIWKRADTQHFTIYSTGDEDDLTAFARDLERFDGLLRFWYDKPDRPGKDPITIYLLDGSRGVQKLLGSRGVAGYYSPHIEGTYAVAHRGGGGWRSLTGQRVLFHEYAHHFMFNEFAVPAPAWLIEGFAEFLATVEFGEDGIWTYGKPATHRGAELRYFDDAQIERLLSWPDGERRLIAGFYGWSWGLTHMLYTAPDRGARISAYIERLSAGEKPLPAARAVFGDLRQLERQLERHVRGDIEYGVSSETFPWSQDVALSTLPVAEGRMLELHLRRMGGHKLEDTRDDLAAFAQAGALSADAYAEMAMAEMWLEEREREKYKEEHEDDDAVEDKEMGGPYFVAAEAAADRALALDASHLRANIVKGRILSHRLYEDGNTDGEAWAQARRHFQIANRTDPTNAEALYRFARSYAREGREGPMMHDAYLAAFKRAPQTRAFRVGLAYDLARLGRHDDGIALLQMLANDPHFPKPGRRAIERIEAMRESGTKFPDLSDIDEDFEPDDDEDDDKDDDKE